ncbi:hypothetical protein [Bremerella sp. P1]|uniref:hypothetical protein n=1 Tax=Bremerella sp. P1 TaxID=3026424 RepID=UPI0023677E8C|nr:hypothetical protein [Bremerella sp. P1]WDI43205.1 hypothetical protein PSR63_04500 [Bremerella sp. P1]
MLELISGKYRVTIADEPTHSVGSVDNVHAYDHEYHLDDARSEYAVASRHAVQVSDNTKLIATCILLASGGASGVHEHSAIINNEFCIVAVGPFMASLRIPTLELQWATKSDTATCFGVYHSEKHHCYISHGEIEIARVTFGGDIVWRAFGADIFTNGCRLLDDHVHVVDFNDMGYTFDIDTGREVAG